MTDRPEDELTPSDWLAAQFGKAAEPPQATPAPVTPPQPTAQPAPQAQPPASPLANPFAGAPSNPYSAPVVPPPAASAPPSAPASGTASGTTPPPAFPTPGLPTSVPPAAPAFTQPPAQHPVTQQPPAQQSAAPLPPAQPVAAQPPAQPSVTQPPAPHVAPPQSQPSQAPAPSPAAPGATAPAGFSWGLDPAAAARPAAPAPAPAPATPAPATSAPTAAPATPPPSPATAAAPPVPPPLVEPPAAEPTPPVTWAPAAPVSGSVVSGTPAPQTATPAPLQAPAPTPPPAATPSWDQPTQALQMPEVAQAAAAQPIAFVPTIDSGLSAAELLGATEVIPAGAPTPEAAGDSSALDSLFGEQNFRDYASEPPVVAEPKPTREALVDPGHISRNQKILLWVAGGVVALLALAALFLLGTRLPALTAAEPTPTAEPSVVEEPEPDPLPDGPREPGVWEWDQLAGGECLTPYSDPWAEEFTVVDCAEPHAAQMVLRGEFAPAAERTEDVFPGADALQGQLSLLCSTPGVIDLAIAGQYPDVQFQGSYPPDEQTWADGDRTFYCFVSRASGEPLTGSLVPPPAA